MHEPNVPSPQRRTALDRGATGIEYAMIGSLIAAIIVVTVALLGLDVLGLFQTVNW